MTKEAGFPPGDEQLSARACPQRLDDRVRSRRIDSVPRAHAPQGRVLSLPPTKPLRTHTVSAMFRVVNLDPR